MKKHQKSGMDKLNAGNKELLDEMKFYLLSGPASESVTRQVLDELEDHLLLAQQNGKTFEDVFGQDPKSYCDELMKEIPKRSFRERLKLFSLIPILLIQWKLAEGVQGTLRLSLFDLSGFLIVSLMLAGIFWYVLRKTSFKPNKAMYLMMFSLAFFAILVYIGFAFAETRFLPEGPSIELHGLPAYMIGTVGLLAIIASLAAGPVKNMFRRT